MPNEGVINENLEQYAFSRKYIFRDMEVLKTRVVSQITIKILIKLLLNYYTIIRIKGTKISSILKVTETEVFEFNFKRLLHFRRIIKVQNLKTF